MIGTTIGPYQVVARLGAGGMGEVYLGDDPRLQRRVALKCLAAGEATGSDVHARIMREARAAARLSHPNIAGVYDVLEQGERTFIVMEYVEGESLAQRLKRGRMPIDEVRAIGIQLASALASAHAQGVIHRDLKPANVHLTPDGSIKVLDFGVAKIAPVARSGAATVADIEPTLGGNPGTPVYMSPEQLFSREIDGRSDIFSAGVMLFEMATGRRPYLEKGAVALALAMTSGPAPSASSINPEVPDTLDEALAKALEREPDHRFQTAAEFQAALSGRTATTTDGGVSRTPAPVRVSWWSRAWKPAVAATVVAAVVTAVAARTPLMSPFGRASVAPVPIAIAPVENVLRNPQSGALGDELVSMIAGAIAGVHGLTLAPRGMTAGTRAGYKIDLSVSADEKAATILAQISRRDSGAVVWQGKTQGGLLPASTAAIADLRAALRREGVWPRSWLIDRSTATSGVVTQNPEAFAQYVTARALLQRSNVVANVDRALQLLTSATTADPKFARAHAALCMAALERYKTSRDKALVERAAEASKTALTLDPTLAAAHYASGLLQDQQGGRDAALASLRRAIQLEPDNDEAHLLYGRLLASRGLNGDATTEVLEAVRLRPDSFENNFRLGNLMYSIGKFSDAAVAYQRAIDIQPDRADAYSNLGATFYLMGDIDKAIGNYEHAVRVGNFSLAYSNLTTVYFAAERYEEALFAALEAIKQEPGRASLHRDLGDVYRKLGRLEEARPAYERAIKISRESLAVNLGDARAVIMIALCEAGLGRRAEAGRQAAEAVTLAPDDRDVLFRAAKVYALTGNQPAALEQLRAALKRGYNPELARRDPDLAGIRALPGFKEAVK